MTPEATLVTIKAFIRHTAVTNPPKGYSRAWLPEPLMENIVRWCINEYYHKD